MQPVKIYISDNEVDIRPLLVIRGIEIQVPLVFPDSLMIEFTVLKNIGIFANLLPTDPGLIF